MTLFNQPRVLHCCVLVALLMLSPGVFADVLVVTGAKSPPITLSKNQVGDIFLGKVESLPDGSSAIPLDQPESNPLRDEFYSKILNKSVAQAKAQWAKLYFTGRGIPPHECSGSDDLKRILNSTPGAIGYIDKSDLDSSVKVLFVAQ